MANLYKRSLVLLLCVLLAAAAAGCSDPDSTPWTELPSAAPAPEVPSASPEATDASATPALSQMPFDEMEVDMGQLASGSTIPELRVGSTGPTVQEVKELLCGLGLLSAEDISQYYDDRTAAAVAAFQEAEGLEPSGRVDALTLAALRQADPATFTPPAAPEPSEPAEEPQPSAAEETEAPVPDVLPLTGIRIGLDPGHQANGSSIQEPVAPGSSQTKPRVSSGTAGIASGVAEYIVNLQVGLKLRDILEEYGADVLMTRETNGVDISNSERAQIMNEAGVDLVVRLHCDGEDDTSRHGAFVLVPSGSYTTDIQAESRAAAEDVLAAFVSVTGAKDLGISERSDQTGFNWSTVPVINIEMGHMSNPEEDLRLVDDAYQQLCAEGIALGLVNHFAR